MRRSITSFVFAASVALTVVGCSKPTPPPPPAPPPATAPPAEPLAFREGMTQVEQTSEVSDGGARDYTVTIAKGELFVVGATKSAAEVSLEFTKDGKPVDALLKGATFWIGYAPKAGDYTVRVKGAAKTAFTVEAHRPRRVLFDGESGQATLNSTAFGSAETDYVIHAHPGQKLIAELQAKEAAPYLSVIRINDGKVLLPHENEADIFETAVDKDGEYIVTVVGGQTDVPFKLLVKLGK